MASIQTQYAIFLSILLTTISFFKVDSYSTETTSFSIPSFVTNQQDLIFQGDAFSLDAVWRGVRLTSDLSNQVGRVLYSAPIHIWDNETGNVANFNTSFTFSIESKDRQCADGMTFFIAPIDTKPRKGGGYLGVFDSYDYDPTAQTIAVELDTFYNHKWDPSNGEAHIGINVNSIQSISTKSWELENFLSTVEISFDAATNVLAVTLTYPGSSAQVKKVTLSDVVHLKDVVPEWVRIGFSASTGEKSALHVIDSWSFQSELKITSSSKQVADA